MKKYLLIILMSCCIYTQKKIDVWIDADPSAGIQYRDVDDGLALIQAFNSPELKIHGISVVFGNTELKAAYPIAQKMVKKFATTKIPVYSGAKNPEELGTETEASKKLAKKLLEKPMVILALGPVTNIATLIQKYPESAKNIKEIIIVAGRRPGQRFQTGTKNIKAHRDFNFERDPKAFQILLNSNIPLVLTPFEISSKVWIKKKDLEKFKDGNHASKWILPHAQEWLKLWETVFFVDGFNPFDTLAIAYLTSPKWIKRETLPVEIRILEDDVTEERMQGTNEKEKPYLLVSKNFKSKRTVTYCYEATIEFKKDLITRICMSKK